MAPFLRRFFMSVYRKQALNTSTNQYCKFNSQLLTLSPLLYLAALLASVVASHVSKKSGRKKTMLLGGSLLNWRCLNVAAVHITMLILGRILLGFGVGFANQSVPIYLSEIAPYKYRGTFNVLFQLAITVGILIANIVNYLANKISGGWGWRVSLEGVPPGKADEAEQLLKKIRGVDNVKSEFKDLVEASEASKKVEKPWTNLFKVRKYRPQLILSALIPSFQQLTGINVVMFYAPVLFQTLDLGAISLMSAVTGVVNVAATFISIYCTDRYGRRALLICVSNVWSRSSGSCGQERSRANASIKLTNVYVKTTSDEDLKNLSEKSPVL
ncbi:hypothetical protein HAX54_045104 [Datura stramonium]|uniref:Major facilitator superfamily (MFS) profile domain-containing protein n=1 Tax=Datura stramonium TaxID=4076 RepID=A0ABS8SRG7_DATST|nr:hypothetical protein [Datura stramonium]